SRALNYEPGEVQPITEFPYFTFLYADLHAHMISMPLQMLALGWAVAVVLAAAKRRGMDIRPQTTDHGPPTTDHRPQADDARPSSVVRRLSSFLSFLVGALAIGVLRPTNTWDWPTYLLLGALAVGYYVLWTDGPSW